MQRLGWLLVWIVLVLACSQPAPSIPVQFSIAQTYCTRRAAGDSTDQAIAKSIDHAKQLGIDLKRRNAKVLAKAVVQEVQKLCGS